MTTCTGCNTEMPKYMTNERGECDECARRRRLETHYAQKAEIVEKAENG